MKFKDAIIHDKEVRFSVFCKVFVSLEALQKRIKAIEEKTHFTLNEYKELQQMKIELAILEEFFKGEECKKYIIEDQSNA